MVRSRLAASLALAGMFGCHESIELGSECLQGLRECLPPDAPPGMPDARIEAGTPDAARPIDAQPPVLDATAADVEPPPSDAEEPSGWGVMPAFENLSFELKSGGPGDVTTVNAVLPGGTLIAPWYTCQPIGVGDTNLTAVRAENAAPQTLADGGARPNITPRDGNTLISVSTFANVFFPLMQELREPLRAGVRYTFALDARAVADEPSLWLQVLGADGCLRVDEVLAESEPIKNGDWQTLCFDFIPAATHSVVLLQVLSSSPLFGGRLLFDNLRDASHCPSPGVVVNSAR